MEEFEECIAQFKQLGTMMNNTEKYNELQICLSKHLNDILDKGAVIGVLHRKKTKIE